MPLLHPVPAQLSGLLLPTHPSVPPAPCVVRAPGSEPSFPLCAQSPIAYSNVALIDPVTGSPVRSTWRFLEDGTKVSVMGVAVKILMFCTVKVVGSCTIGLRDVADIIPSTLEYGGPRKSISRDFKTSPVIVVGLPCACCAQTAEKHATFSSLRCHNVLKRRSSFCRHCCQPYEAVPATNTSRGPTP